MASGNWIGMLVVALVCGIAAALSGSSLAQGESPVRYDGYQLWRVIPQSKVELEVLDFLAEKHNLSFWRYPSSIGRPVDVMVSPSLIDQLTPFCTRSFASFKVLQTDIQRVIDKQYVDRANLKSGLGFEYHEYHTLDEIEEWMDVMVNTYGNLVSKQTIGTSYEGRSMDILKISTSGSVNSKRRNVTANAEKPGIFIEGGIHAREWISPATVIYMTNQLLEQYETSPEVQDILDHFDWYILPVFNVDGYEFTWTNDRMWRKTRSPTLIPLCQGTDPNRNWDDHWSETGASADPCSETYYGASPFSEVEVQAVADFIKAGNFQGFIDFHSYSQLWMTPWGWTRELPPDFTEQDAQSVASVEALEAVHGTVYEHGTIANTIYVSSGTSVDWAYDVAGVFYSVTVELRDTGRYGFLLPADQIIPCGEETFEGLKQYALYMIDN